MNTAAILDHFRTHGAPLTLSRAGAVAWDDAEFHRAAHAADPESYLLTALVPGVHETQRARALLQTLLSSRAGLPEPTRAILDKATRALLFGLPPAQVITVLLAVRRHRANHKHVTRATVAFVLDHPDAELLIAARRPALRDCLEHALGKNTARACLRHITDGTTDSFELHRKLLRFTTNPERAVERLRQLYAPGTHGVPVLTEPVAPLETVRVREPVVTVTNRGDIAATLVHLYRGGSPSELASALAGYVDRTVGELPRVRGHLALVLDATDSMRGYGDREWALLSQAEALRLVLARLCEQLTVIEVGAGQTGPTDLATGVLDALEARTPQANSTPDLVVVVTDGYENRLPGDLARVVATLPTIGVHTPIVLCQALFTGSDDRTLRDPAPALPTSAFWHQDDFAALLPWLFARTPGGADWIRTATHRFLDARPEGASR
ncbi:vWA domain-containing protein [Nocardia heshunensis]